VGAVGAYLLASLGGTARLILPSGWWIDLMILTWSVFALLLFVLEPLGLLEKTGLWRRPCGFLTLHALLRGLALVTVAVAVIGSHGGF